MPPIANVTFRTFRVQATYFKLPGTDLESLPELDAAIGDTAGRKIRIFPPPFLVSKKIHCQEFKNTL